MHDLSQAEALTPAQVAQVFPAFSVKALEKLRLRGGGPAYSKPTAKRVIYLRRDIEAWLAASRRNSTSEAR